MSPFINTKNDEMIARKVQKEWGYPNVNDDEEFASKLQNEMNHEFGNNDDMFNGENNLYDDMMGRRKYKK